MAQREHVPIVDGDRLEVNSRKASSHSVCVENAGAQTYVSAMSRAFVKEDDVVADLPDRPISDYPNHVTSRGLELIDTELDRARRALAAAQSSGDRSALAAASRETRYWSARRATAQIVPSPANDGVVHFGSRVVIARDDGREQTFRIVGEDEADPAEGTLSHASPLARSLLGKAVGEVVRAGRGEAEIVSID